jgi:hypothetical protein
MNVILIYGNNDPIVSVFVNGGKLLVKSRRFNTITFGKLKPLECSLRLLFHMTLK